MTPAAEQPIDGPVPEEAELAGCCGLYCGLCPRYQSTAPSRCLGCHRGEQHAYCSIYRCCVMKREHITCADCEEFACERLLRVLGVAVGADSFISHKPAVANLDRIREEGLAAYLKDQRERQVLAEHLLAQYNDGRSMTFYCTACALMEPSLLRRAIDEGRSGCSEDSADGSDRKARARALRLAIQNAATAAGTELRLRRSREQS